MIASTITPWVYNLLTCHAVYSFSINFISISRRINLVWILNWHVQQLVKARPNNVLHSSSNYDCYYRLGKLLETIMSQSLNKTIIFVETKKKVDDITRKLRYAG